MSIQRRVYILDKSAYGKPLYEPWLRALSSPFEIVESYDLDWAPPSDAGIVVTGQHYQAPEVSILRRLTNDNQIPVLIIADGILEYRNTWLHPALPPGAIFQPVMGHKISCLGRSQARMLESWGNLGKCEVVGSPRLDSLCRRTPRQRDPDQPFRFLVMTAKTPGFTAQQLGSIKQSLADIKTWFERSRRVTNTEVDPIWRITAGLGQEIGVQNKLRETTGADLADVLQHVDAVITTPSTVMLEAMLQGVPVALLDYNNCPHYVPAAWTITARHNMDQVFSEMIDPPAPKMLYQDTILHDSLECRTPAVPRMIHLVEEMIRIGQECRARNVPVDLPQRILRDEQEGHHLPEARFDYRSLYRGHPVFDNMDRAALQVELGHLLRLARRFETHPLLGRARRFRQKVIGTLRRLRSGRPAA